MINNDKIALLSSVASANLTVVEIPPDSQNNPTKAPMLFGWNKPYSEQNKHGFGKQLNPSTNTNYGLLHSASNTIAFDLDDLEVCNSLFLDVCGLDVEALLTSPDRLEIRSPKKNRGKLIFKLPDGVVLSTVKKLVIPCSENNNGKITIFELRGGANQDVIIGTHPEGGDYSIIGDLEHIPVCPDVLINMALNWEDWKPVFDSFFNPVVLKVEKKSNKPIINEIDPIAEFNKKHNIRDILHRNGYKQMGERFIRPGSSSGAPGVVIYSDYDDGIERAFSFGGDDLANGHAHDPFNCFKILEHGGDFKKAIQWQGLNPVFYKAKAVHVPLAWEKPEYKIIEIKSITPFSGIMESIVKQVLSIANKPQPELTILSALVGMAAAIGGNYKLPGGGRLNLYGIGISKTGTGKDKAMLAGTSIAHMAGSDVVGMPGSGAALEDSLSEDGTRLLLNIDEAAHFVAAMNDQNQTHMASLSGNLLKLFSASRSRYITRKLANSSGNVQKTCNNPCVSLLGFSCPEKLGEAFGAGSNVNDGLMGRILFANGRDGIKPMRDKGELHFHEDIAGYARLINHNQNVTIKFSQSADSRLDYLINHFHKSSESSDNPFSHDLKTRSFEKCERIAGVLAVWDNPESPVISIEHVNWAESFINYSDESIIKFTSMHLHGGKVQADSAKIMATIFKIKNGEIKREAKHSFIYEDNGIPRTSVLKATKLSKKEFDEAIDHLVDCEKVNAITKDYGFGVFKVIFA